MTRGSFSLKKIIFAFLVYDGCCCLQITKFDFKKKHMDVSPSLSFSFRSFVFLSNTPRLHSRGGFWSADRHTQEQTATLHSMLFFFCFLNTQKQHHRFWLASLLGSLLKLLEDANRLVDGLLLLLEGFLLLGECLLLLRQLLLDVLGHLHLLQVHHPGVQNSNGSLQTLLGVGEVLAVSLSNTELVVRLGDRPG